MTDVRKRIPLPTRYELHVWDHHSQVFELQSRFADHAMATGAKSLEVSAGHQAKLVTVQRWRVERPVVTETRHGDYTRYYFANGCLATEVEPPRANDLWSFFHPTEFRHRYFATRAEAERACRKHLRSIGYRVVRAKEGT